MGRSRSQSSVTVLPAKLVYFALGSLAFSLVFNTVSVLFKFTFPHDTIGFYPSNHPSVLPLKLRSAALTMTSEHETYSLQDAKAWRSIIPDGHGFVAQGSPENRSLYQLTMFHEVHCLLGFRQYFNVLMHGGGNISGHAQDHAEHCSSYMAQLMLCGADTTLEPTRTAINVNSGRRVHAVQMDGVTHQCRDWTQVRRYLEDNFQLWKEDARHYEGDDMV